MDIRGRSVGPLRWGTGFNVPQVKMFEDLLETSGSSMKLKILNFPEHLGQQSGSVSYIFWMGRA